MHTRKTWPVLLGAILFGSACGTIAPRAGFTDVQGLVRERLAARLNWAEEGSPEDAEVNDHVRDLLSRELTPEAAVQIALLRNRTLQAAYTELGVAQADLVQAGLLQNPVLTADVRFGINSPGLGADIGVVQEFLSILQIPLRKRVAKAAFERTKLQVAAAVVELAMTVKATFYALQGAEQMLELRQTAVEAYRVAADVARAQRKVGNITDLEFATEQAAYEEARVELAESETEVLKDREELTALLGLWGNDTEWKIARRLPGLPEDDVKPEGLERLAVSQRVDLAASASERVVLAQTVGLTRFYGFIPEASAGAESEREIEGGIWSLGPSISLPIPLFDRRQATLAGQQSQSAAAEDRYAALAVQIRSEVRRARIEMLSARARTEYYRNVLLPLRSRVVEEAQRQYNAMVIGVYQLLQAKREEVDAGRRYVESLTDFWVSRTALERAVGGDLPVAVASTSDSPGLPAPEERPMNHDHHHGG